MSHLHRCGFLVRHDRQQAQKLSQNRRPGHRIDARLIYPSAPVRLPARCRGTRAQLLDALAFDNGHIPYATFSATADRNEIISFHLWQAVPMLGMRRRLPELDEQKHTEGQ